MDSIAFTELSLKKRKLKNRFIRSATAEGLADNKGNATDELTKFYIPLAKKGPGMIITGYTCVSLNGCQSPRMSSIYSPENRKSFQKFTQSIKKVNPDVALIMQLVHTGSHARKEYNGNTEPIAPSRIIDRLYGDYPREMNIDDIQRLQKSFVQAALNAQEAGFDGVQIHAAHGYLISQFLSKGTNLRKDKYGDTHKNRYRFLKEILQDINTKIDTDSFLLSVKMNGADYFDEGNTIQDSIQYAQLMKNEKLAFIEISGGTAYSGRRGVSRPGIKSGKNDAYFSLEAAAWKKIVPYPVASVGGYRSLETCEKILSEKKADLIALSRPFVRESDLIQKWENGISQNSECVSCNRCYKELISKNGLACYHKKR